MRGTNFAVRVVTVGCILLTATVPRLLAQGPSRQAPGSVALVGARIYTSPDAPPIASGTVLLRARRIVDVGPVDRIVVPRGSKVIDCHGLVITAGFWNSHVHILTQGLLHAERLPDDSIGDQLKEMLTRWGFTTVFDIASVLSNTNIIRRRIASGRVVGPRILTVGEPFYPKDGAPIYIRSFYKANHLTLPEVQSVSQAVRRVDQQVADGADAIKIFSGSIVGGGEVRVMDSAVASAIVSEAHRLRRLVFAHPSNGPGMRRAIEGGVDILAHTAPLSGRWDPALLQRMKARHMSLIPTLTLFDVEGQKFGEPPAETRAYIDTAVMELHDFAHAGGEILFGTDAGYITQYDTSEEFDLMSRAGMSFQEILASLTVAPARRFRRADRSGRIARGFDADLVVLDGDPAKEIKAFAKVRYTIRSGRVIYQSK